MYDIHHIEQAFIDIKFSYTLCYNKVLVTFFIYMTLIKQLGFLRISLLMLGIIDTLIAPEPGTYAIKHGIDMIPTLVAPAAAPIILMVILFDALMSKIRASDAQGEESKKFKRIMWAELTVVAFMLIGWLPYYLALGQ